jgi:multidrug resistance efflux pump
MADAVVSKDSLPPGPVLQPARRRKLRRWVRVSITAAVVVVAAGLAIWAYCFYEYNPWTRDGRVRVYVIDAAPEVSGLVTDVPVIDNQFVHKGDLLYRIDPRDYQAAVKRAQAALDGAKQQLALQQDNAGRRAKLRSGDVSDEEKQTYSIGASVEKNNVDAADAALYKAKIDLERCEVHSMVNGWVTNLTVRAGDFADAGHRQMSVVDADSYWIYGYFEETQLRNIKVGAHARAVLMGYPGSPVAAHVDSIGRGITDTDATADAQGLPQVNPVFTWVRLAQRIPVRLHIENVPTEVHLAAGETCTIYIDPN